MNNSMKFESFRLSDLCLKGEGNLHVVVLNARTGQVFRFPKENRKDMKVNNFNNMEKLDTSKLYKLAVSYKKYNVFQKFWGKDYLPKTRVCLFPKQIIEQIAIYLEDYRQESRKGKEITIKTSYIEIQPDLTILLSEYNFFSNGSTYCIELKPKFGILFRQDTKKSLDCRNRMSRFCIGQLNKPICSQTNYCPCDLFSGNPDRMTRAIKCLIQNPQEKIRIFQDGKIANLIDKYLICKLINHLFDKPHIDEDESLEKFCHLIIQALLYDVSDKRNPLKLSFKISTDCEAHSWSEKNESVSATDMPQIYSDSVLGKLISTSCLVEKETREMNDLCLKLYKYLEENNIEKNDDIFDLWNEHLLPLDLPENIIETVRILKRYLVCLTVRDCSVMIRFRKTSFSKLNVKLSNAAILKQSDGTTILSVIDVIDISIKPLGKIKFNFEYEQALLNIFQ